MENDFKSSHQDMTDVQTCIFNIRRITKSIVFGRVLKYTGLQSLVRCGNSSSLHVVISLGKILNPQLSLKHSSEWECVPLFDKTLSHRKQLLYVCLFDWMEKSLQ